MTGCLTCEPKPRNHVPEEHAQKRDAHVSPDWLEDSSKIKTKQNKTATPANRKTGTKNVGEKRPAEKSAEGSIKEDVTLRCPPFRQN